MLRKAFDEYDTDKSGKIEGNELKQALEKAGKHPSIKECDWLIKQVDKNGNNAVDFNEFEQLLKLVESNAYAKECGGMAKLIKQRNDDLGKYKTPSSKWAKTHGSGFHGGSNYKKTMGIGPGGKRPPPAKKSLADLP